MVTFGSHFYLRLHFTAQNHEKDPLGFLNPKDDATVKSSETQSENYFKLLYYFDNGSLVGFADYLYSRQVSNFVQILSSAIWTRPGKTGQVRNL